MNIQWMNDENMADAVRVYTASWRASHTEVCSKEMLLKHDEAYQRAFLDKKVQDGWTVFIGYENNAPVGIVGCLDAENEIGLLYVHPDCERRGYGDALLSYARERMSGRTYLLHVLSTNVKARRFYEKRGLTYTGKHVVLSEEKHILEMEYADRNLSLFLAENEKDMADTQAMEAALGGEMLPLMPEYIRNTSFQPEEAAYWEGLQTEKTGFVVLACQNKKTVGMAVCEYGRRGVHLASLYVEKAARQNGIGELLLQRVKMETKARGYQSMTLNVVKGNERVMRLYERAGFEVFRMMMVTKI